MAAFLFLSKFYGAIQSDLFIAILTDVHGLCVVTRNVKDFKKAGVAALKEIGYLCKGKFGERGLRTEEFTTVSVSWIE